MDLGLTNVNDTYKYVLNQSGSAITLGNGLAVNWNAGGVVDLASTQIIIGSKTFNSTIIGSINGNAATATIATNATNATNAASVTNGVYTIGNQNINGIKTFTSSIYSNNLLLQGDNSNGYVRASGGASNLYLGANNTNYVTITTSGQVAFNYGFLGTPVATTNFDLEMHRYPVVRVNPTAILTNMTTSAVPSAGSKCTVMISGAAVTHSFLNTKIKTTAALTALTAGKTHTISFVSDGVSMIEIGRGLNCG